MHATRDVYSFRGVRNLAVRFHLLQRSPGSVVLGRWGRRSLRRDISLGHATINNKIGAVDEAGLITGKEHDSVSLLDSLTEAAGREVHLASVPLLLVVTQPVLQQRCVERRRTQAVEAISLAGVDHGQFSRHGEDGALGGCVSELRSGSADEGDDGGGVDDGAAGLFVAAQGQNGMLAAEPDTLDVDVLGQIPDGLGGVGSIVVLGVHDAGVVEDDVEAAPGVNRLNHGLNFGLFGHIAFLYIIGWFHVILSGGYCSLIEDYTKVEWLLYVRMSQLEEQREPAA